MAGRLGKILSILIFILLTTTLLVNSLPKIAGIQLELREEWIVRFNGEDDGYDNPTAMAIDSFGNIYVTGYTYKKGPDFDFTTVAYDTDGNELWVATYGGPANGYDHARAIDVGPKGNVYVTGESMGNGTENDYATVAYDSMGNELWVRRYNGPRNIRDEPCAIVTDTLGNVYVTGKSYGNGTHSDFATIAYDAFGNELWVARYNGIYNDFDAARGIAIDSFGYIYVTGICRDIMTKGVISTVKYAPNGTELWSVRWDPGGADISNDIAISPDGIIYVTGCSYSSSTDNDYSTIAYDSSGNTLWTAKYNGPMNGSDQSHAITTDSHGNVYITGYSAGVGTFGDFTTIKYDSNGNELWIAKYNSPGNLEDHPRAIALDPSGNVFVTGESGDSWKGHHDFTTVAYDEDGNEIWVATYDGPGSWYDDPCDIAIDDWGNVYVTGWSFDNVTQNDYTTIKYSGRQIIQATIDIDPDTLNLKSNGRWITCYITLNSPFDVNDINISTIMLEDTIPAEWGDIQGDILMVKFDRSDVEDMLSPGTYNLKVTGELTDGTLFEGYSDEIRVIDPGK